MKRPSPQRMADMKEELYRDLARGDIDIREASRRIRRILGMSQKDYALKVAKISPRILSEFEKGTGNPTVFRYLFSRLNIGTTYLKNSRKPQESPMQKHGDRKFPDRMAAGSGCRVIIGLPR